MATYATTMTARELKNKTGAALRMVRSGGSVAITLHGKPVGILSPIRGKAAVARRKRGLDRAWKGIEDALARTKPAFKSWREAEAMARGRS